MWDLNLCVDDEPKQLIPFEYFVRPDSSLPLEVSRLFTCFAELPVEIQLEIFDFCDAPTLFQLMHTSTSTRKSASKRFWAQRKTWYCYRDTSLFNFSTTHPIPLFDLSFASQIKQIEIGVEFLSSAFRTEYVSGKSNKHCDGIHSRLVTTTFKAGVFWENVQAVFPAAERVVVTGQPWAFQNVRFPQSGTEDRYVDVGLAMQQAPADLEVFIALRRTDARPQQLQNDHRLWRIARDSNPPSWNLVHDIWTPTQVLLPLRKFASYPLGALLTMISTRSAVDLDRQGLHWLTLESYARYPSTQGTPCPSPDCLLLFATRTAWAQHMHDSRHNRMHSVSVLNMCANTPADEHAALERRLKWIINKGREAGQIACRLQDDWSDRTEEGKKDFDDKFYEQLKEENMFAPGELVWEKCPWIERMEELVDPVVCCLGLQ